jgi:hypothetical protein
LRGRGRGLGLATALRAARRRRGNRLFFNRLAFVKFLQFTNPLQALTARVKHKVPACHLTRIQLGFHLVCLERAGTFTVFNDPKNAFHGFRLAASRQEIVLEG